MSQVQTVNDVHSGLNPTSVKRVERPRGVDELCALVRAAAQAGEKVCIAGGRHAMGGQQFREGGVLVDTGGMSRMLAFDRARGLLRIEAGALWPAVIAATRAGEGEKAWAI